MTGLSARPRALIVSAGFGSDHDRAADLISWQLADRALAAPRVDLVELLSPLPHRVQRRLARRAGPGTIAVVATHPLASRVLGRMRASGMLAVPVITYLTDLAVGSLWISPGTDHHLAVHPLAAAQAAAFAAQDVEVTGPVVAPAFTATTPERRWLARRRFGLPEDERIALVVGGGRGQPRVERTAKDVLATGSALPVVVCGADETARDRIARTGQCLALGRVEDMPSLLHAADIVVQPGRVMSIVEALASGVPAVSYRCLSEYSRLNAAALEEAGWALWAHDPTELGSLLSHPPAAPKPPTADRLTDLVLGLAGLRTPV